MTACRECHREDRHNLSCSHVRYEGRLTIAAGDEVAADHEFVPPYCAGPDACHHGLSGIPDLCSYSDGPCYYGTQTVADWEAEHGMTAVEWSAHVRSTAAGQPPQWPQYSSHVEDTGTLNGRTVTLETRHGTHPHGATVVLDLAQAQRDMPYVDYAVDRMTRALRAAIESCTE